MDKSDRREDSALVKDPKSWGCFVHSKLLEQKTDGRSAAGVCLNDRSGGSFYDFGAKNKLRPQGPRGEAFATRYHPSSAGCFRKKAPALFRPVTWPVPSEPTAGKTAKRPPPGVQPCRSERNFSLPARIRAFSRWRKLSDRAKNRGTFFLHCVLSHFITEKRFFQDFTETFFYLRRKFGKAC